MIATNAQIQKNEICINYPHIFVMLLKFLTKTTIYYPRLFEKFLELVKYFPKFKLECASESLTSKTTEYLCIHFCITVFKLVSLENHIIPQEQRQKLQYFLQKFCILKIELNLKRIYKII